MQTFAMPDELHFMVQRGGSLSCLPAADADARATQCTTAWALSMMFGGDWVRVRDYLPGLHLDIQSLRVPEPPPPGPLTNPLPMRRVELEWRSVERKLWEALHRPVQCDAVVIEDAELRCVILDAGSQHDAGEPAAFTLQCRWPSVLGTEAGGATRSIR